MIFSVKMLGRRTIICQKNGSRDSLGEVNVPSEALYGAQTQRAAENFQISPLRFPPVFLRALGMIKAAAAEVNGELGLLDAEKARAIQSAALEIADGRWNDQFVVDVFQTGSGTSTNMNANEAIARLASKALGAPVHPNDEVNLCQSSNDVIPAAIHVSACLEIQETLAPGLRQLRASLLRRAAELDDVVKTGRTHLMDAAPIRLGQEIAGWASHVQLSMERIDSTLPRLYALALGGTAVGTGVNAHPEFARRICARLAEATGLPFRETEHHFSAQAALDGAAEMSGQLKTTATALLKIANDLRWMNSGPIAGLGEIALPALQPGSSIMPGKINPVILEAVAMACVQVIGNDTAIALANASGAFQLNTMMPLIAYDLLQSISLLGASAKAMAEKAVDGFTVNREAIAAAAQRNPILATALNPVIGYDQAAEIAKRAYKENRPVLDVAVELTGRSREELEALLDPRQMTEGGLPAEEGKKKMRGWREKKGR